MGQTVPRETTEEATEPSMRDVLEEANALREEYRRDPERNDDEASPQAFYERSVQREDVREILERLAKG